MTINFDSSILSDYYSSRAGVRTGTNLTPSPAKYAPTAPWSAIAKHTGANTPALLTEAVKSAMAGHKLIDESSAKLDLAGASSDYKKLFALFQGLNTLAGVADQINGKALTTAQKDKIKAAFNNGLTEIKTYTESLSLEKIRIAQGDVQALAKSSTGITKTLASYVTPPLVSGDISAPVPSLAGDVKFNIHVKRAGVDHDIAVDLAGMGATPRSLGNVVNYINDMLATENLPTRFATLRIPGGDRTIQNGKTVIKVGTNPDSWALNVKVDSGDTVTFSATDTAPSVYVAQGVGNPDPDNKPLTKDGVTNRQILKFQTEAGTFGAPPRVEGDTHWVDGEVWARDVAKAASSVRATQVGPDGSVYVLADVTGKTGDQSIKGTQDVALQKYDSAGKLVYTRTLGAAADASGLALAVSADGKIAVAGKVTGRLGGATEGPTNSGDAGQYSTNSDSFVTVFNDVGEEVWTQRRGARLEDEATNLAFGADGSVYVAGRSKSAMPGTSALGNWDSYVEGFKQDLGGAVQTLFTQTVGSAGADHPGGLVVDGTSIVLANIENGHGIVHRYDVSGATPVETSTHDLGDLQGGDIVGVAINGGKVVVAGSTRNGALDSGRVSSAATAGLDGFVVQLEADLSSSLGNNVAYFGGSGDDRITGLAVSGGKVFIGGQAGSDLPGLPAVGTKDGFVASLDIPTGVVDWSRRFSGKDGYASPTAIAVDAEGASSLDRLGLPKGELHMKSSLQITAVTSLRAGDQLVVRSGLSATKNTVTIEAGDTFDTLAVKLRKAMNYQAEVKSVIKDGVTYLQIKPGTARNTLELFAGPADRNALTGLGLPEGVVRNTVTSRGGKITPTDGKGQIYGLKFDGKMTLDDAGSISHVVAELATAMGVVRAAYKDLKEAATPASVLAAQKGGGTPVPAYLKAQIANYQDALNRLGG